MNRVAFFFLFAVGAAAAPLPSRLSRMERPLFFEPTATGRGPSFISRAQGSTLVVATSGVDLWLDSGKRPARLTMRFAGAQPGIQLEATNQLSSRSNYFIGSDAAQWRTGVPNFGKVRYTAVYPGVDCVFYGAGRQLEYDFIIKPGADPSPIALDMRGARSMKINANGDLDFDLGSGHVIHRRPVAYQVVDGRRVPVEAAFRMVARNRVGFSLGQWDRRHELVIDPVLTFATYFGGSDSDSGIDVAVDPLGNVLMLGSTRSTNFAATQGAVQTRNNGARDLFVTKVAPAGTVVYTTYLGGNASELAAGIATDASGAAYIVGDTQSPDFPTRGAFQATNNGGAAGFDGFIAKIAPNGASLVYSSYFGGNNDETFLDVAVDSSGAAYITGSTESNNFPVTASAFQRANRSVISLTGFAAKVDPSGSALLYSTYLGGTGADLPVGIAVDGSGQALIIGGTASRDFPTTAGVVQPAAREAGDAFIARLNAAGSQLVMSTFLGGRDTDTGFHVAIDSAGNIWAAGVTKSTDFPLSANATKRTLTGPNDAFVVKLTPNGATLSFSTLFGGLREDLAGPIVVDRAGRAYIGGQTSSTDLPAPQAFQTLLKGPSDAFVAQFDPNGALLQASFLGGGGSDSLEGLALDSNDRLFAVGSTDSSDFPTTAGAPQAASRGGNEAWLARIEFSASAQNLTITPDRLSFDGPTGAPIPTRTLSLAAPVGANPRWTAQAATGSGGTWLSVSPTSGTGSATLTVTATPGALQAGTYNGTITILNEATSQRTAIPVTLTLRVPEPTGGMITSAGVVNAASFREGPVSPGLLVTIFGRDIGPATLTGGQLNSAGRLDTVVAQTRVLFDGQPAPIVYASATQLSCIVPFGVAGKLSTQLQVEYRGLRSNAVTIPVAKSAPALFTANSSGRGQVAALNQDGSFNNSGTPAQKESVVVLYGTGEGTTDPGVDDGTIAGNVLPKPVLPIAVRIGGIPAQVLYAGAAPGLVAGVIQLNVMVPANAPSGDVPIVVLIGSEESQPNATIAVQ